MRLHTKINEGAADVHSLMVFRRLYPDQALHYTEVLAEARRNERATILLNPEASFVEKVGVYDNASCLDALRQSPVTAWPTNQKECTIFALHHALPFLRQEPLFKDIDENLVAMAVALEQGAVVTSSRIFSSPPPSPANITSRQRFRR